MKNGTSRYLNPLFADKIPSTLSLGSPSSIIFLSGALTGLARPRAISYDGKTINLPNDVRVVDNELPISLHKFLLTVLFVARCRSPACIRVEQFRYGSREPITVPYYEHAMKTEHKKVNKFSSMSCLGSCVPKWKVQDWLNACGTPNVGSVTIDSPSASSSLLT